MSAESWKISLPCTREEGEALAFATDPFPGMEEPPVLNTLEPDETRPEDWLVEAIERTQPANVGFRRAGRDHHRDRVAWHDTQQYEDDYRHAEQSGRYEDESPNDLAPSHCYVTVFPIA